MSAIRTLFWLLLTYVLWQPCSQVLALNPALDVSQYAHTAWRNREGFTTGAIGSLAQTPDGYLWLGTEFGLVRFDGVRTAPWQPPAGFSLPDNHISSLLAARDGTLWVGTIRGLVSLKGSRIIAYPQLEGTYVTSLVEDRTGTVWAGAGSYPLPSVGLLCAMRSGRTECYGENARLPTLVIALWEDSRDGLWVATGSGVWRWNPGPPKLYSLSYPTAFQAFGETPTGTIIALSQDGVNQIIGGEVKGLPLPHLPRPFRPTSVLCDHD